MAKATPGTHRTQTPRRIIPRWRRRKDVVCRGTAMLTYDEFGQKLHLLAGVLTDDADLAERLVIQTILAYEPAPSTLQELSAGVYVAWMAWGAPPLSVDRLAGNSLGSRVLDEIRGLPADQRAALGLCKYGDHSYRHAAEILGLAPGRVARLLHDALQSLATTRVQQMGSSLA